MIVPPLNRCLLLVGVDCAAWYTDLPRPARTLAPALLNRYASESTQCCGSGIRCFLTSGSGPGSGMNNPDHISKSLKLIFGLKYLNSYEADPGYGMEKIRIRDKPPGSTTLVQATSVVVRT